MKNLFFIFAILFLSCHLHAQNTYYWVGGDGGNGAVSFTTNSKWNTALDGSGTSRVAEDSTDILIFDGSNIGGATPMNGNIVVKAGSTAMGQLILRNNANLTLLRMAVGNGSIKIKGDATDTDDLQVPAGCALISTTLPGLVDSAGNNLIIQTGATGRVEGSFSVVNGGCKVSVLNTRAGGALFFESGSVCNVNTKNTVSASGSSSTHFPFGSSSGANNGIVFKSGSTLNYLGGSGIFTSSSTFTPLVFNPGSVFVIKAPIPNAAVTSSNFFSGRFFANVVIASGITVDADNYMGMQDLAIQSGATLRMKASGVFPLKGNLVNDGRLVALPSSPGVYGSCNLLFHGTSLQTVSGAGIYDTLGAITVAADAHVALQADLMLYGSSTSSIAGILDLNNHVLSGIGKFQSREAASVTTNVTSSPAGTYTITLDPAAFSSGVNTANVATGMLVSGTGILPNTFILNTSSGTSSITISNPVVSPINQVTLSSNPPTLITNHINGIDGSIAVSGTKSFGAGTNYIFNSATISPFPLSSNNIMGNVTFLAPVTSNKSASIGGILSLQNGNFTIRSADTIRMRTSADIAGAPFSDAKHIITEASGGMIGKFRMDSILSSKLLPIGTATHYLPVTLNFASQTNVYTSVYEGMTQDGTITGSPLSQNDLDRVVNAVWDITRSTGATSGNMQLGWSQSLEGSVFTGLTDGQIGVIQFVGNAWGQPAGTVQNATNTASLSNFSFGAYGLGAVATSPTNAFIFAPIADKTYGDADFNVAASSSNTTQPILYTSSNPLVASVSSTGLVHIVGAGTTSITASQQTDGTYPDTSVARTFTVNKAALIITANSFTRNEGVTNPTLTVSYSGFVNGEDAAVLQTQPIVNTTATLSSTPGVYPITLSGASAVNYDISYVNGTMTVVAVAGAFAFDPIPNKTYGDADFTSVAVSQNITQPIIYSSSNTAVATISTSGLIQIVGVGTTSITASQASDGTYPAATVTQTFVVSQASLVITANNATRVEGAVNPVFTVSYAGFVNGESSTILTTPVSINTTATITSLAGTYPIIASGAVANNYNITYVTGTLTITPAPVTGPITYYWVGGTGSINAPLSFSGSSRWNTALDGSGSSRPSNDTMGILIIDGSNIGGATQTTGIIYSSTGSTKMSQLVLRNSAQMNISRITTGNGTITIKGDSSAMPDMVIESGSAFTLNTADSVSGTSGNNLLISTNATGQIYGTLTLGGGTCRVTVSNPLAAGALFFENGSICNTNTQINYYPFGSSAGVHKGVIFKNGSKLVYKGGKSFFRASSSSIIPIEFQPGSTCRFEANVPNAFSDSSLFFSNRNFANVEIGTGVSVHADDFYNIDNLTIESDADFALRGTSSSPISGNITNNGTFGCISGFTSSILLMKGLTPQTIGGSGTFNSLGAMIVAAGSDVALQNNLTLNGTSTSIIHGKLNLGTSTLSGTGSLQTRAAGQINTTTSGVVSGTRILVLPSLTGISIGMTVSGTGIAPNTYVMATSSTASTVTLSDTVFASVTDLQFNGSIPQIRTAHADGVDGSIGGMNTLTLATATDYVYDGATTTPFSMRSLASVRNITFNAPVTTNRSVFIDSSLSLNNGLLTIRPSDTVTINNGLAIGGVQNASSYIYTQHDAFNAGVLRINNLSSVISLPIGSATHYLPVRAIPTTTSSIAASVYEGVTTTGALNATPLSSTQLQTLVNAVWKLNRLAGTGNVQLELNWDATLEGSQFSTANNALIGLIQNNSGVWSAPFGNGDNTANTVSSAVTSLGYFSVGAVTNASPFVFNTIPDKTYGDADFNTSIATMNTTQPVLFESSNTNIATVSATGLIHIVGSGSVDITASQNTDGFYPSASITRTLIVNKSSLTVSADNKTKFQGAVNPTLTYRISGFVLGETESVLLTPVVVSTTATTSSIAGNYPITVSGATAANYNISFAEGVLSVLSQLSFASIADRTYGNSDFATVVSSMNTTQPILYASSNANVATISASGVIHIVGAGVTDITVSQASDGVFPDITVTRSLTVNKASLTISVADTTKNQGAENPVFRFVYSGFVLGESEANLIGLPVANTLANVQSVPGVYAVMPEAAVSSNYTITYQTGNLTVLPVDVSSLSFHVFYAEGGLNLRIYSPIPDLVDILLFDNQGHFITRKNLYAANGLTSYRIELGYLASGIYAVQFRGKQTQQTKWVQIIR